MIKCFSKVGSGVAGLVNTGTAISDAAEKCAIGTVVSSKKASSTSSKRSNTSPTIYEESDCTA